VQQRLPPPAPPPQTPSHMAGPATNREQRSREEGETKNKADPKRKQTDL